MLKLALNKMQSKECDTCYYWYFLNNGFKFQPNVCNRCHELLMMSMDLSDVVILMIKGSDIAELFLELTKVKL